MHLCSTNSINSDVVIIVAIKVVAIEIMLIKIIAF